MLAVSACGVYCEFAAVRSDTVHTANTPPPHSSRTMHTHTQPVNFIQSQVGNFQLKLFKKSRHTNIYIWNYAFAGKKRALWERPIHRHRIRHTTNVLFFGYGQLSIRTLSMACNIFRNRIWMCNIEQYIIFAHPSMEPQSNRSQPPTTFVHTIYMIKHSNNIVIETMITAGRPEGGWCGDDDDSQPDRTKYNIF